MKVKKKKKVVTTVTKKTTHPDKSITLKEDEWKMILESFKIEEVKIIIQRAVNRKILKILDKEESKLLEDKRNIVFNREFTKKKAEEFREGLIKRQTPSEVKFKAILKLMNIKYEFQKIFYTEQTFYIVDFYLPEYKIIIEIDGGYHKKANQKMKDGIRTEVLSGQLKKVCRIKNECIKNTELTIAKVKEFIKK